MHVDDGNVHDIPIIYYTYAWLLSPSIHHVYMHSMYPCRMPCLADMMSLTVTYYKLLDLHRKIQNKVNNFIYLCISNI